MHRRSFLNRCGLAVAGSLLIPSLGTLQGAGLKAETGVDTQLMRRLSAYSTKVYLWDADIFAQTTGLPATDGAVNLLVRVNDLGPLTQFLASDPFRRLGTVFCVGNTLSFTFKGTKYTITNAMADDFKQVKRLAAQL